MSQALGFQIYLVFCSVTWGLLMSRHLSQLFLYIRDGIFAFEYYTMDYKSQLCKLTHLNQLSLWWWKKPELKNKSFCGLSLTQSSLQAHIYFTRLLYGRVVVDLSRQRRGAHIPHHGYLQCEKKELNLRGLFIVVII